MGPRRTRPCPSEIAPEVGRRRPRPRARALLGHRAQGAPPLVRAARPPLTARSSAARAATRWWARSAAHRARHQSTRVSSGDPTEPHSGRSRLPGLDLLAADRRRHGLRRQVISPSSSSRSGPATASSCRSRASSPKRSRNGTSRTCRCCASSSSSSATRPSRADAPRLRRDRRGRRRRAAEEDAAIHVTGHDAFGKDVLFTVPTVDPQQAWNVECRVREMLLAAPARWAPNSPTRWRGWIPPDRREPAGGLTSCNLQETITGRLRPAGRKPPQPTSRENAK